MIENELYVYHIVTRKKMSLGQIISFDKNEYNTLYRFFFEREQLNSKGEDFIRILQGNYTYDGLTLNKENADVAIKYVDQTIRAIREVIVEMVRLQEHPEYPSRLSCLYYEEVLNGKSYLILTIGRYCRLLNFELSGILLRVMETFYQRKMGFLSLKKLNKQGNIGKEM
jgi:hypothetical protein